MATKKREFGVRDWNAYGQLEHAAKMRLEGYDREKALRLLVEFASICQGR
jgi:hypothetical protein